MKEKKKKNRNKMMIKEGRPSFPSGPAGCIRPLGRPVVGKIL